MDRGALVPDEVIVGLMAERLDGDDAKRGFILDGFPRTLGQAEALEKLLSSKGLMLDRAIVFEVAESEVVVRLSGRRVCRQCGANYHVNMAPPKIEGQCDRCGGELYQREDDKEETIRKRLQVYRDQTAPLLQYYGSRNLLVTVDAAAPIEVVEEHIRQALRSCDYLKVTS
jgi:adenylate kinase